MKEKKYKFWNIRHIMIQEEYWPWKTDEKFLNTVSPRLGYKMRVMKNLYNYIGMILPKNIKIFNTWLQHHPVKLS